MCSDLGNSIEQKNPILVVDDSAIARKALIKQLEDFGITDIVQAENGAEAFNFIVQQEFDLVITDLEMPKMDGFELLRSIKNSETFGHIPVVLLTSATSKDVVIQAASLQADSLLTKPADKEKLYEILHSIFYKEAKKINFNSNILVVDDVKSARKIAKRYLRQIGFTNIFESENGKEAIKEVIKRDVDLILTDWLMPEIDGNELLKLLKSNDDCKDIPVIMISSFSEKERILEAASNGAASFISKPYNVDLLQRRVFDAL